MKERKPVTDKLAAKVMYMSDRTCCVCTERGKHVQIHHIDGNPKNNAFENLAVLCTQCHDEAHLTGGVTRRLTAKIVIEYKENWLKRVADRIKKSDEMAVSLQVGERKLKQVEPACNGLPEHTRFKLPLLAFINTLPQLKATLSAQKQPKLDTGVNSTMVTASYDYIDSIVAILIALSSYYSEDSFGNQSPEEYFSEIISSRFQWHRSIAEPGGSRTGGTMVKLIIVCNVEVDVETMVEDMVHALVGWEDSFDFGSWRRRWHGN